MGTVILRDGSAVPSLGQGSWMIGEDPSRRQQEVAALRRGIELGLTLIDTAQMYGGGRSEQVVGEAIRGHRDEVYLVDKVLPSNASRRGTVKACEGSLRALGTEWIDLYLLHWVGPHPMEETVAGFAELQDRGLVREWGVSNFDVEDLALIREPPLVNQVLYNLSRRGPEYDLLHAHRGSGITTMAYSPIEQARILGDPVLAAVAERHQASPSQVALAWVMRNGDVIAIPKASSVAHVEDNAAATTLALTDDDLADLDRAFPAPTDKMPLQTL